MSHPNKPVRYVWDFTGHRYLYKTKDFNDGDKIRIPLNESKFGEVYVNILERVSADDYFGEHTAYDSFHVKLFYPDGKIVQGWFIDTIDSIKVTNADELLDGRFNQ